MSNPRTGRLLSFSMAIIEALTNPGRRNYAIFAVVLGFVGLWTIYGVLVHAFHDIHPDIGQTIGWWRNPSHRHHPPGGSWILGAWFSILPMKDWPVYLLASTIVGLTLLIAWVLFGDWLEGDKRVVALAMLSFLPFFSFLGTKPNANLIQVPFWAATTLVFLRSFCQQNRICSLLVPLCLAGALLSKFWAVYLAAGMALAAILDGRRRQYFASATPWVTAGATCLLLFPFALSLFDDLTPMLWASESRKGMSHSGAFFVSIKYIIGTAAYALPGLLVFMPMGLSRQAISEIAIPTTPDRCFVARLFWLPLLLPALVNIFVPHRLTSLWTSPNWILLPILLLGSRQVVVTRRIASQIVLIAVLLPMLAVIVAPVIATYNFLYDYQDGRLHYRKLAESIETSWRLATGSPLRFIGGNPALANGAAFYLNTTAPNFSPQLQFKHGVFPSFPAKGIVYACLSNDKWCMLMFNAFQKKQIGIRFEYEFTRSHLSIAAPREKFVLLVIPPKR